MREDTEGDSNMKKEDNPIQGITKRLDFLQERFGTFDRLKKNGSTIDDKIIEDMQTNYTRGLEHLHSLKAYDELRAYKAWYTRYLNIGDPL
jgi:hypothetical protein